MPNKATQPNKKKPAPKLAAPTSGPRRLHMPERVWHSPRTWRYHQPAPDYKPLPEAHVLLVRSLQPLRRNKKTFLGIVAWYGVLNLLLVRGLSGSNDLASIKSSLSGVGHGFGDKIAGSFTGFTYLLSTSGNGNTATSGVYQELLLIVCSLAFIWALRQTLANHSIRVRDGFYKGMYSLIPFSLLSLLLGLQLVPLALGGALYSTVVDNAIAVNFWEKLPWLGLFIVLGVWSLRMVTASIIALYIVTLPDATPLMAYRSARNLVRGRRLVIWRKLLFLLSALLIVAAIIELPLILYLTPVAEWMLFILTMCALPIIHSYLYGLYRELL